MGKPTRVIQLVIVAAIGVACMSLWKFHQPAIARTSDQTQEVAEKALALAKQMNLEQFGVGPVLVDPIGTYSHDRTPRAVPSFIKNSGQVLRCFSTVEPKSADIWDDLANDSVYCWAYMVDHGQVSVIVYRGRSAPETFKSKTVIEGGAL